MYVADQRKQKRSQRCKKIKKAHRTLSPEILTVYCPHEISQGFQPLEDVESPRTVFDFQVIDDITNEYISDNI